MRCVFFLKTCGVQANYKDAQYDVTEPKPPVYIHNKNSPFSERNTYFYKKFGSFKSKNRGRRLLCEKKGPVKIYRVHRPGFGKNLSETKFSPLFLMKKSLFPLICSEKKLFSPIFLVEKKFFAPLFFWKKKTIFTFFQNQPLKYSYENHLMHYLLYASYANELTRIPWPNIDYL